MAIKQPLFVNLFHGRISRTGFYPSPHISSSMLDGIEEFKPIVIAFSKKYSFPQDEKDISEECYEEFHNTLKFQIIEYIKKHECYMVPGGGSAEYYKYHITSCKKCLKLNYPKIENPGIKEWLDIQLVCRHWVTFVSINIYRPKLAKIEIVLSILIRILFNWKKREKMKRVWAAAIEAEEAEEEKRQHDALVRAEKSKKIKEEHISRLITTLGMRYNPDNGKLSPCFDPIIQREIALSSGTMFAEIMAEATKRTMVESAKLLEAHRVEEERKKREEAHKAELLAQETERCRLLEEIERLQEAVHRTPRSRWNYCFGSCGRSLGLLLKYMKFQ